MVFTWKLIMLRYASSSSPPHVPSTGSLSGDCFDSSALNLYEPTYKRLFFSKTLEVVPKFAADIYDLFLLVSLVLFSVLKIFERLGVENFRKPPFLSITI